MCWGLFAKRHHDDGAFEVMSSKTWMTNSLKTIHCNKIGGPLELSATGIYIVLNMFGTVQLLTPSVTLLYKSRPSSAFLGGRLS